MPEIPELNRANEINFHRGEDYREGYANSTNIQVSVWDFFLVFGRMTPHPGQNSAEVETFQGVYLSPQQAKALAHILAQNVRNYEATFGEIVLEPTLSRGPDSDMRM